MNGARDPDRLTDVDEWGRSERFRSLVRRAYQPLYDHWFRVEWEGLERIPREGGALLVANHAGALPADAPAIMHGIETELARPVYGLADELFTDLPVLGTWWSRAGGVLANPDNAYRLLVSRQLVLAFPEGTKGTGKPWSQRYQLARFGRGGFVRIAMRAGVPLVPIAVVGSEEAMPILAQSPSLARRLGLPYLPLTANMVAFGPLGALVWFPAKLSFQVLEPIHFAVEPHQPRYSRPAVLTAAEDVRDRIQGAVDEMRSRRRSAWRG